MKKKTTTPHDDMIQEQFDDITNALTDVFSEKFGEALERGDFKDYKPGDKVSLKPKDTPILEAGDGYEIILPESYKNAPQSVEDFGDIQEVHFGKMPLSEVFAKQPAKKRIRAIEKAKAKIKRRKANKAAKQSRKNK